MFERIHSYARIACTLALLSLAACGGGGGGSGGGPDPSTAPGLTVSPTSVTFTAVHNGAIPPTQNIQITITQPNAAFVGVGFPVEVTPPTWLDQDPNRFTGAGSNWTLTGAVLNTSMAPGTYTTTLRVAIADGNQNILAFRDVQVSYTITASPISANPSLLNFNSVVGGGAPVAQTVTLGGEIGPWTASADQPWIGVAPGSGVGIGGVNVSADPTGLSPNTHNGSVTFSSGGKTAVVNVALTVSVPGIQTNFNTLSFSGVNGASLPSQSLAITMNNGAPITWTASAPLPDTWLVLNRTSGTAADPLVVSVNPTNGSLTSGTYNSSITLQGVSGGSALIKTVTVTMTLTKATLTASPPSATLVGANSSVPLRLNSNTGANVFAWNSTASSFIQRSPPSGSVSSTPVSVTLTPNTGGISGGTQTGSVTFSLQVNGDTVSAVVPVTFLDEAHKLLVVGNGVALIKTPQISKLTQTLRVLDNLRSLGVSTTWSATSDQPWLSVTPSGGTPGDLVLTADPTGLGTDTLKYATVAITSSDTSVENTEKIRVGLWIGSNSFFNISTEGLPFTEIVADPIRPYAYVAVGTDIHIYNIYDGTALPPIFNVAGQVGPLTVSHDGTRLFAVDTINGKIVPVDLPLSDTPPTVGAPFSVSVVSPVQVIDYTRTNGVELILSGSSGQIFNARTGDLFTATFVGNVALAASLDGSRFCTVDVGLSTVDLSCPSLAFTSANGGQPLLGSTGTTVARGVNAADIAVSVAGTVALIASGSSDSNVGAGICFTQDLSCPSTSILPALGLVNNVEFLPDGRTIVGAANISDLSQPDVLVYTENGFEFTRYRISTATSGGILARQLKISGDGLRLIALTLDAPNITPTLVVRSFP